MYIIFVKHFPFDTSRSIKVLMFLIFLKKKQKFHNCCGEFAMLCYKECPCYVGMLCIAKKTYCLAPSYIYSINYSG